MRPSTRLACLWLVTLFVGFLLAPPVAAAAVPARFTHYDATIRTYCYPPPVALPDSEAAMFRAALQLQTDVTCLTCVVSCPTGVATKTGLPELVASTRVAPWAGNSISGLSTEGETMYRVWGGGC